MTLGVVPKRCKAIVLRKAEDQTGLYKFDAVLEERDVQPLKDGQVLVKIEAAGFNYREVSLCYAPVCVLIPNLSRFGPEKVCTPV